ncbi:MAG TPA: glycoside hydrolase family 99-like domain-containing protein [Candidatus Anaerostipes avicola]|nr:glycoside hydrolase family 99-like domain-containing protein [uncultured Anaerostipes sp.]HJC83771.1 glycoside hydrolase family 99-like domain-containing protein [Candidatus Anaerostipes avicola]
MSNMKRILNNILERAPLSETVKVKIHNAWAEYKMRHEEKQDEKGSFSINANKDFLKGYTEYVLKSYGKRRTGFQQYKHHKNLKSQIHLAAYYLTQYHPNIQNDEWWGKGTTEWNNVNQAIPQFIGHYQPRKPGELGYYDLRLKENMERQIELAKNYGISEFCFYYYWFDGQRLLERPLNMFLRNKDLKIEFSYCWANENWTKRFSGTDAGALMKITQSVESYVQFIDSILCDMLDSRYHRINGRPVLSIYRPSSIPNPLKVLRIWRDKAKEKIGTDLYLIAILEANNQHDWLSEGFDALSEFQPRSIEYKCKNITKEVHPLRKDFSGKVYDYEDLVLSKRYDINFNKKCYPAVMPMWDNTARRNHRGTIFHGSTPDLYKLWLENTIERVNHNLKLDEKRIFINAWNEWGEGAYMEPDYDFGYAYLQATYEALVNKRV